ncbi:MAG: hypothetical protein R3C59_15635 [Planctomycetaceae bacterium]
MSTPVDRMLYSTLSQHAGGYAEKQLIKAGDLGTCAARVIKSRRKLLRLYHALFLSFLLIPVIVQFAAWMLSPDRPTMWHSFLTGGMLAMTQLPVIFSQHVSLARLETVVSIWLLRSTDDTHQGADNADVGHAELITGEARVGVR